MKPALHACPTCRSPLDDEGLGLRDYRWVSKFLPGRVAPTDLDGVLERAGNYLVMEYKQPGVALPMGQRILLRRLVKKGSFDVWVCWGDSSEDDAIVEWGKMDARGELVDIVTCTAAELGAAVVQWWEDHEFKAEVETNGGPSAQGR